MKRCAAKPYEGQEKYIFVSYCHKDRAYVFPVIEQLAKDGYRVWYDEGIDPGSEWPEIIAKHLNGSAICIAFITVNSLNSHNCRREINFALLKKKYFISVVLEPVQMSLGMEMQLSSSQSIFKYTLSSEKEFFAKLYEAKELEKCKGSPNYSIEVSTPNDYVEKASSFDKVRDSFSDKWFTQGDNETSSVEEARRKAEEAARKAAAEEARRKAEEAARKAAAEEARRKAEEAARKAAAEEARRKAEEAARKAAAEEMRRKAEEAARKAAAEEARRKAEEAARKVAAEEARRKAEEAARKAAAEEEVCRKAEEAARKAAAEEEARRKAEEAARKAAAEEARRKAEEAARKAAEEARRKAEEAARKAAAEEARRKAEEAARKAAAEESYRKAEEAVRKAVAEEMRRKAEEAARKAAEEEARRKAEEAARKAAAEEAHRKAEEAARKAAAEEARRKAEEAAHKAAAEEARRKVEEAARKAAEEAERAKKQKAAASMHMLRRERTGEIINIIGSAFKIGRSNTADNYVITDNRSISRSHATLLIRNDICYIVDNHSLNKTFVNGAMIAPGAEHMLVNGDNIRLYNERFVYLKYHD